MLKLVAKNKFIHISVCKKVQKFNTCTQNKVLAYNKRDLLNAKFTGFAQRITMLVFNVQFSEMHLHESDAMATDLIILI